jgi:hypothetical protein
MAINYDQSNGLMRLLANTRENELNCNECLDKMPGFAERRLAGGTAPDELEAVKHHLSLCTECSEEFNALLTALKMMKRVP